MPGFFMGENVSHILHRMPNLTPLSHYLLVRYSEELVADPDQPIGELVRTLYAEVYRRFLDDDQLVPVCERIIAHGERMAQAPDPAPGGRPRAVREQPGFGTAFAQWRNDLSLGDTCFWLANFDAREAQRLYAYEDYELVESMLLAKVLATVESNRIQYESSLFGNGGKYGGGGNRRDEGEVRVHDVQGMSTEDFIAKMNAAGRRH